MVILSKWQSNLTAGSASVYTFDQLRKQWVPQTTGITTRNLPGTDSIACAGHHDAWSLTPAILGGAESSWNQTPSLGKASYTFNHKVYTEDTTSPWRTRLWAVTPAPYSARFDQEKCEARNLLFRTVHRPASVPCQQFSGRQACVRLVCRCRHRRFSRISGRVLVGMRHPSGDLSVEMRAEQAPIVRRRMVRNRRNWGKPPSSPRWAPPS